jgi:hypothetical protein
MVAVTGLMSTDTLFFQAARTYLLLKQNHYSIGTFREKSFVGNYVSDYFGNDYIFSL